MTEKEKEFKECAYTGSVGCDMLPVGVYRPICEPCRERIEEQGRESNEEEVVDRTKLRQGFSRLAQHMRDRNIRNT